MAIKTLTTFGNGRDDDRISGFTLDPGIGIIAGTSKGGNGGKQALFGGLVVTSNPALDASGKVIQLFDGITSLGVTNPFPLGLLYEATNPFPASNSGDTSAGAGHDTLDYARGGIYSVFHRPGNFVEVYDDARDTQQIGTTGQNISCPFLATETFAVGSLVYATGGNSANFNNAAGRLTVTKDSGGTSSAVIGIVRANNGLAGSQQSFTLELLIQAIYAIA